MVLRRFARRYLLPFLAMAGLAALLWLSGRHSYLLFHSLVELFSVVVAFSLFTLAWHTRRFQENDYLLVLGVSYAFIALIDLVHTLAFRGMNIFGPLGANPATQLWIAARWLQALALVLAPIFAYRRFKRPALLLLFWALAVSLVFAAVASGNFPVCYVDGSGLTPFKIASEYLIIACLALAIVLFLRVKSRIDPTVQRWLVLTIALGMATEFCFTQYIGVYDFMNMLGHFFKLAACLCLYRALLVTGFTKPYDLIFRDLSQAKAAVQRTNQELEALVTARTSALAASENRYHTLFETANDAILVHGISEEGLPGRFVEVNRLACERLGYTKEEFSRLSPLDIDAPDHQGHVDRVMEQLRREGMAVFETAHRSKDGRVMPVEMSSRLIQVDGQTLIFSLARDISDRKKAEDSLRASLAEKDALLRELYHRTKNNMGVIIALLDLQASHFDDPVLRQALMESQNRIRSMALVHQKLYEGHDLSQINLRDYILDLARQMLAGHATLQDRVRLVDQTQDVMVTIDAAVPCGLILNELITNTLKYAFPDNRPGTVRLACGRDEGSGVWIEVEDDGVGFPAGFDPRSQGGMGMQTLHALGERQLQGSVAFRSGPGVLCALRFPDGNQPPRV